MKPGPIRNLSVRQTGDGEVTASWDPHPEGVTYVVRWGPLGSGWGAKYDPPDGMQNQHPTDVPSFVLAGMSVGDTGEIQVVAFDDRETGSDRYGPISPPQPFEVTEWVEPEPPAEDDTGEPSVPVDDPKGKLPVGTKLAVWARIWTPWKRFVVAEIIEEE